MLCALNNAIQTLIHVNMCCVHMHALSERASHKSEELALRRRRLDFQYTMEKGAIFPAASSGVVYPMIHPCWDRFFPDVS